MMFNYRDRDTRSPAVHLIKVFDKQSVLDMIQQVREKVAPIKGTHVEGSEGKPKEEKRVSTVRWFMDNNFEGILRGAVDLANYIAGWKYEIVKSEMLQFTEYGVDGHYGWHTDGMGDNGSIRNWAEGDMQNSLVETKDIKLLGTVRKLSTSVILNEDYEGGELEFRLIDGMGEVETTRMKPPAGSVVVFPSYIPHRVAPITKGTRYSVVAWYGGPPFK